MKTKNSFTRFALLCLFITFFIFLMPLLSFAAQPGVHVVNWNTYIWADSSVNHDVHVVDYDGIANDGSTHNVIVTYPDLTQHALWFNYTIDDYTAVYSLYDNSITQPIDPGTYSGNYVYRVTDIGTGEWSEMTDYVDVDTLLRPDETTFSPGYGAPQSIIAHFDNVYVNGSSYDDFESGFDPARWESQPPEVVGNETQAVAPGAITVDGNGADWAGLTPALVDPQGDSTGGVGADIKHVFTAKDDTYAYVMVETYNQPVNPDAWIELNFNYKDWQHLLHGPHDDLHVNFYSSTLDAWNDNDLDGTWESYPISGYVVAKGNVLEARIPLSEIENAGYFNPSFVNIWTATAPPETGDDPSTIVPTIAGEVHFERIWNPDSGSKWMWATNPETINELKATVRVESISGDIPYARIGGTFCHDSVGEVGARVGIRGDEAIYAVYQEYWEGDHYISNSLVPMASLGSVTQGNNYEISLDWDEPTATFTFRVIGLDDSVNYEATYTVSGTISPPDNPERGIGIVCWLQLDTTTPTFDWDEISGANHYRVRIYGLNDNRIYTGYTKTPPFTLPPGVLKPDGIYKYRIYAQKENQWFEADNVSASDRNKTRFIAGPDEAQDPYVDLHSIGVETWTSDAPVGAFTDFYIKVHDAQGVPGNIESVKVLFPDGSTEVSLYLNYNDSNTCARYQAHYFGTIQPGEYTFTVIDKDGNSHSKAEILTSNPISPPVQSSFVPANNAVVGDTGVSFDWDDVSGAAFYQLKIYDKDLNQLYDLYTIESEYTFPPGILEENSQYRYRVYSRREFFEDNSDNGASAPGSTWNANTFFTTATYGSATPTLDLDSFGVAVWQSPHPATGSPVYELEFWAMVTDSDGVPENIERVEVTYPDGTTTRLLKYLDASDWGSNYYDSEFYTDPSLIPSGIYSFKVVDFDGNEVTLTDTLTDVVSNVLPWPTNLSPADDTVLTNTTPIITWDTVSGASYYKVRILRSWGGSTVHWSSELTQTQYTVPGGVLEPNTIYSYRVYAYREAIGSEVDFISGSNYWHSTNNHFTTGAASGDELAVDFGGNGLWHYDGSTWNQLNGQNPEGMEDWDGGLASDFETSGLWNYDGSSWNLLTTLDPEGMKTWTNGLAVDFSTTGLWNYNGSSWDLLTTNDPQDMESWTDGLAVDFGTFGLWNYDGSIWNLLTTSNAQDLVAWANGLAVDFGTFGLWSYNGSSWDLLTTSDAQSMESWSGGLAVNFDTFGLWNYNGSSWGLLTTSNAEYMAAWANGLAVDFGGTGLWSYDGSSWDLLTTSNAQDMEGWATSLAVDLGGSGLWNYDGSSWASLTGWDSEDIIDVDLY